MKLAVAFALTSFLFNSAAFAQYTCAEDPECQKTKIEAMSRVSDIELRTLKQDVLALRGVFMLKANESSEGGEYGGFMRGVTAMDEYLARIEAYKTDPSFDNRGEIELIQRDVKNLRAAYL